MISKWSKNDAKVIQKWSQRGPDNLPVAYISYVHLATIFIPQRSTQRTVLQSENGNTRHVLKLTCAFNKLTTEKPMHEGVVPSSVMSLSHS